MMSVHRRIWVWALLFFTLFVTLFTANAVDLIQHDLLRFGRAVAFWLSIALFNIGWSVRERAGDETVIDLLLKERELRSHRESGGLTL